MRIKSGSWTEIKKKEEMEEGKAGSSEAKIAKGDDFRESWS